MLVHLRNVASVYRSMALTPVKTQACASRIRIASVDPQDMAHADEDGSQSHRYGALLLASPYECLAYKEAELCPCRVSHAGMPCK